MSGALTFAPLVPWPALALLGGLAVAALVFAAWRRLAGWALRAAGALALLAALAGPGWQREERSALNDIVIAVVDESASQRLGKRADQSAVALDALRARIAARPGTDLHVVRVGDAPDNRGTRLMSALAEALADVPTGRVAGIFAISDGQIHDADLAPDLPAPLHLLRSGAPADWDRRIEIRDAPAYAILGEEVMMTLRIDDQGAAPDDARVPLQISVDGGAPFEVQVPVNSDLQVPVTLDHAGLNVLHFTTPAAEGELTARNNAAVLQINGVRDRLRVLLVSGEPHPGERSWRNLLKSDASVDLVHFTILRPPEKLDDVPVTEMSLIAFPTRELFLEKIDEFDLIIFDRYQRRGILPSAYLDNVRRYVAEGGAVLVAAGPDFASAQSLYRSPLADVLPAAPTARVVERAYRPALSDLGARHPVTRDLGDAEIWGRWLRQIEVQPREGAETLMTGAETRPLLVLDRVGEGRVALLASDHVWLWARGYEGGGPQAELLRRLAHWLMKEPELEEDTLTAEATGLELRVIRRTLSETVAPVTITGPDGAEVRVTPEEVAPGRFEARWQAPAIGLYRLADPDHQTVIALGPVSPVEFEQTIASDERLAPLIARGRGGAIALSDGVPRLRDVRPGRPAAGPGWLGLTPRNASERVSLQAGPLLPAWAWLLISAGLLLLGWLRESRR